MYESILLSYDIGKSKQKQLDIDIEIKTILYDVAFHFQILFHCKNISKTILQLSYTLEKGQGS
jgi:predicted transport protein